MRNDTFPHRLTRRALLKQAAGLLAGGLVAPLAWADERDRPPALFITASDNPQGQHFLSGFDDTGALRFQLPAAVRCHGGARHPHKPWGALFARRPGDRIYLVDLRRGTLLREISAAPERHFYGHGLFSPDGRWLYATENDYANERGVIGIYDAQQGFTRVGEHPSHGIGPHEMRLLSDGRTLVVANGGILTHPDYGRLKLNLDSMQPKLSYIDRLSGKLLGEFAPEHHQLSIRHLDVSQDDQVIIGLQYQGNPQDRVPLALIHTPGARRLTALDAPAEAWHGMRQYTASVCVANPHRVAAITAPRGHRVTFWHLESARYLGAVELPDPAGVAWSAQRQAFVVTTGTGSIHWLEPHSLTATAPARQLRDIHWDNHLAAV